MLHMVLIAALVSTARAKTAVAKTSTDPLRVNLKIDSAVTDGKAITLVHFIYHSDRPDPGEKLMPNPKFVDTDPNFFCNEKVCNQLHITASSVGPASFNITFLKPNGEKATTESSLQNGTTQLRCSPTSEITLRPATPEQIAKLEAKLHSGKIDAISYDAQKPKISPCPSAVAAKK